MSTQPLPSSPNPSPPPSLPRDRRLAVGIFFLALAIYTLTYVGAFKSNDERALFSGADSFWKRGEFTVNQIYWDYTNVGMDTNRGDMVPNYEPAQMVTVLPFYAWGRALGAAVQGVMFFGVFIAAAAAALLYLCVLALGYTRRVSLLTALIFAFATMMWPYSRTFFREPPTTLAYLLATYALLRYRCEQQRLRWPALAGAALGLALTTKQISVALIPTLLILAFVAERERPRGPDLWRQRGRATLAALLPLALFLLLQRLYALATLSGVEVFARDLIEYTTNPQLSQSVPMRMLRAFVGLSISPYKGLFWYAPVLLLGLIGFFPFVRRQQRRYLWEGVAFLLLIGIHFLGYSRYNYWSGGVAWGSRYMLPLTPFFLLLAAPIFAWLIGEQEQRSEAGELALSLSKGQRPGRASRLARAAVGGLILLSVFVQVLGISIDLRTYELDFLLTQAKIWGGIGQAIEGLYLHPSYSPVLGHLRLLLGGGQPLDFAWVQLRPQGQWAFVPAGFLLSLVLALAGVLALVWVWRKPRAAGRVAIIMTGFVLATWSGLLLIYRHGDARFDPYGVDPFLRPLIAELRKIPCGWRNCNDALLVPDPVLTDYFLNYLDAPLVWYATDPEPIDDKLMERLTARYGSIWLGRDRSAAADDAENRRASERYLLDHAYKASEQTFADWARLLHFSAAGFPAETASPQQILGEMVLDHVRLNLQQRPPALPLPPDPPDDGIVLAQPGDTLQIGLTWRALQSPQANYTVFVQMLDPGNQVVAQNDHWPGHGLHPTASLSAGQTVIDNLALPLDLAPGDYRLITGLYRADQEGYPRLTGPNGDFAPLATVRVLPP